MLVDVDVDTCLDLGAGGPAGGPMFLGPSKNRMKGSTLWEEEEEEQEKQLEKQLHICICGDH